MSIGEDVVINIEEATSEHPSRTEQTALVIPCHNSEWSVLENVLISAQVHFNPEHIFIVENSNSPTPTTTIQAELASNVIFNQINYVWLPIGNKSIAQYLGALAAAKHDLQYILTIDDDVMIPPDFICPIHLMHGKTRAVCFPVTAVDENGDKPTFVAWQDIEYKLSALAKMAESKMCGVLYPHGAASFWDRKTMIQVLRNHDLVYFADDIKMGLELQALGLRLDVEATIQFNTLAPTTFMGVPLNYYQQRVRSWEMARHTLYWQFLKRYAFSLNGQRNPIGILWQKFAQTYTLLCNLVDFLRAPVLVLTIAYPNYWVIHPIFFFCLPMLPLIPYKLWKIRHRSDLQPEWKYCFTYSMYKVLYSVVSVLGLIRSVFMHWPAITHKPTLAEMEEAQDSRCVWLRPEFPQQLVFFLPVNNSEAE